MKHSRLTIILAAASIAAAGVGAGYGVAKRGMQSNTAVRSSDSKPAGEDRPLYWYDPMVPNQHFDKPGKSPFMDMQLVPKYANEASDAAQSGIKIDPSVMQNLGVRLATVQRGVIARPIEAAGNVVFNQRDVTIVQTRANGFVVRIYQHAPGDVIARNAPVVDLLVPEWAGAQAEFLSLLKSNDSALVDAARQRLMLLGMPAELIADLETTRQPHTTITARTPIAGVIDALEVREGMSLSAGATLAKINGINTVWLEAQVPETQSALVQLGQAVKVSLSAYPGEIITGKVIAILPEADVGTRTVRVRVELPNPQQRLRPGLLAQLQLDTGTGEPVLFVPSESVIRSGTRNLVILRMQDGSFAPAEIKTGREAVGKTIVLDGLQEGQQVVASGQFLIDSEASLQGVLARLANNGGRTDAMNSTATTLQQLQSLGSTP